VLLLTVGHGTLDDTPPNVRWNRPTIGGFHRDRENGRRYDVVDAPTLPGL
jgi:hypothetical protein